MIGFARLIILGLIGLTVLYWLVRIYGRSLRREALEKEWDGAPGAGTREAFVEDGMARYEKSLRRKLVWLVYILPITAAIVVIVLMNYHW